MIDDKVKIKCTKCSQVFRERAQKVRPNFQTNCAHCNRLITFEFGSDDPNIRRALSSAKEIRVVVEAELKARAAAEARVPSGKWLEFVWRILPGSMKLSFQAARSIG
jgi:hypothetical protein